MKKWDIVLILAVVLLAGVLYFSGILRAKGEGGYAVVYIDGKESARYSLSEDGVYTLETEAGYNILKIENGVADIIKADCRDEICVKHRPVSLVKESITCLPHKLVVEIEGTQESPIDAVAQ